jgi:hypothetical protein
MENGKWKMENGTGKKGKREKGKKGKRKKGKREKGKKGKREKGKRKRNLNLRKVFNHFIIMSNLIILNKSSELGLQDLLAIKLEPLCKLIGLFKFSLFDQMLKAMGRDGLREGFHCHLGVSLLDFKEENCLLLLFSIK